MNQPSLLSSTGTSKIISRAITAKVPQLLWEGRIPKFTMVSGYKAILVLIAFSNSLYSQIDGFKSPILAFEDLKLVRISKNTTLVGAEQHNKEVRNKHLPKNWALGLEIFTDYNSHTGDLGENYMDYVAVGIAIHIRYKKITVSLRNAFGFNKTKKDFEYYFGVLGKDSRTVGFLSEASLGYVIYQTPKLSVSPFAGIGLIKLNPISRHTIQKIDPKEGLLKSATFNFGLALDIKFSTKNSSDHAVADASFLRIRYGYGLQRPENDLGVLSGNIQYITIGHCSVFSC